MTTADYYATITQRLRDRLGDHAEGIIQLALDASNYAPHITEPGIGDQVLNAVYSLIVMIDGQHHAELEDLRTAACAWNQTMTPDLTEAETQELADRFREAQATGKITIFGEKVAP